MITLTWNRHAAKRGVSWRLTGPDGFFGSVGARVAYDRKPGRRWCASAGNWWAYHGSSLGARRALERYIERNSVGLFGDDAVEFVQRC